MSTYQFNLNGEEGNAYFLLATARKWMLQLNFTPDQIESNLERMKSSTYNALLTTFEDIFESYPIDFVFLNDPRNPEHWEKNMSDESLAVRWFINNGIQAYADFDEVYIIIPNKESELHVKICSSEVSYRAELQKNEESSY